jgi:hypothetical protein
VKVHVITCRKTSNFYADSREDVKTYSEIINSNVARTLQLTVFNCMFACAVSFVTTAGRRQQCVSDMCTFEFCCSYVKKENVLHHAVFGQRSNL